MKAFLKALVCDKSGAPDEAAISYIAVQLFAFCGFAFNAYETKRFDPVEFMACETALVTLYNLSVKK